MQGVIVILGGRYVDISQARIWHDVHQRLVIFVTREPKATSATSIVVDQAVPVSLDDARIGFARGIGWAGYDLQTAQMIAARYAIGRRCLSIICDQRDVDGLYTMTQKLFPGWHIEFIGFGPAKDQYSWPLRWFLRFANWSLRFPMIRRIFSRVRSRYKLLRYAYVSH